MQPREFKHLRLEPSPLERFSPQLYLVVFWITVVGFLAASAALYYPGTRHIVWPQGLLLVLANMSLLMGLSRQLPAQNVVGTAILVATLGGAAHALGSLTGVPFGPYVYSQDMGRPLFGALPWTIPFFWVLFLFASRGVARLVLRPWRRGKNYGFQVIGLTCVLVVLLEIGLEVFATRVFAYWEWSETKLHLDVFGVPLVNFVAWALVTLLILAFTTPLLINKKPGAAPTADFHPLVVWVLTSTLLATGSFAKGYFNAGVFSSASAVIVAAFAIYGGKGRVR